MELGTEKVKFDPERGNIEYVGHADPGVGRSSASCVAPLNVCKHWADFHST